MKRTRQAGVPIVAGPAGFAPLDLGGAGELEGAAGSEVEEQEGGFRVEMARLPKLLNRLFPG